MYQPLIYKTLSGPPCIFLSDLVQFVSINFHINKKKKIYEIQVLYLMVGILSGLARLS